MANRSRNEVIRIGHRTGEMVKKTYAEFYKPDPVNPGESEPLRTTRVKPPFTWSVRGEVMFYIAKMLEGRDTSPLSEPEIQAYIAQADI